MTRLHPSKEAVGSYLIIYLMCLAEILGMAGTAAFPALLPRLSAEWSLTPVQAGWTSSAFYVGYTIAVPLLVSLTDQIETKRIYLGSMFLAGVSALGLATFADGFTVAACFQFLMGVGLAGSYMPGLRLLTDQLSGAMHSRATSSYVGCYAVGTSISFLLIGLTAEILNWRTAVIIASLGPLFATALVGFTSFTSPRIVKRTRIGLAIAAITVLKNKDLLARTIAYAAHNFEMFGLWAWSVAFVTFTYSLHSTSGYIAPAIVGALVALTLMPGSILGNEFALRLGQKRWIILAMVLSACAAPLLGFGASQFPVWLTIGLSIVYGVLTAAETGTLTASVISASKPESRGMTMAFYSTIGFFGASAGPLMFGVVLTFMGASTIAGWGSAFLMLGIGALAGPLAMVFLRSSPGRKPHTKR